MFTRRPPPHGRTRGSSAPGSPTSGSISLSLNTGTATPGPSRRSPEEASNGCPGLRRSTPPMRGAWATLIRASGYEHRVMITTGTVSRGATLRRRGARSRSAAHRDRCGLSGRCVGGGVLKAGNPDRALGRDVVVGRSEPNQRVPYEFLERCVLRRTGRWLGDRRSRKTSRLLASRSCCIGTGSAGHANDDPKVSGGYRASSAIAPDDAWAVGYAATRAAVVASAGRNPDASRRGPLERGVLVDGPDAEPRCYQQP